VRYVMGTSGDREPSAQLTDGALAAEVTRKARCADGTLDPDEWFPVSTEAQAARREAAGAIAICTACPVRGACLELSLRRWTIGQHGVWGGLVAADRAALRRRWLASPHEYGRALSILDGIWDGPPATSHAGRGDQPAAAALTSRHALSSMRAVRMARALLRHLTAAAPGRDQARPGGRSIPPAASVPQIVDHLADQHRAAPLPQPVHDHRFQLTPQRGHAYGVGRYLLSRIGQAYRSGIVSFSSGSRLDAASGPGNSPRPSGGLAAQRRRPPAREGLRRMPARRRRLPPKPRRPQ
jgi:Transcription factor WhiB